MDTLPELFCLDARGKKRIWKINVHTDGSYKVTHGVLDGTMVTATRQCLEKNVGKKNATNLREQAYNEAKSKWNKKIDEGYYPEKIDNYCGVSFVRIPVLPMLATIYNPKKVIYPCSVQPKLDGVRALYYHNNFYSRNGKLFVGLDHLKSDLEGFTDRILDGEIYNHDMSFQEKISAIKKPNANTKLLNYYIYDMIESKIPFQKRFENLKTILSRRLGESIRLVETYTCYSEEDIERFHKKFVDEDYEGSIIRNNKGLYKRKARSDNLQKRKDFIDEEFEIVGFTEGEGIEKGLILFRCKSDKGTFSVRPKGTHEIRHKMFLNGDSYIGKICTVKFQEYTDFGIPRFPVGVAIRDYEN